MTPERTSVSFRIIASLLIIFGLIGIFMPLSCSAKTIWQVMPDEYDVPMGQVDIVNGDAAKAYSIYYDLSLDDVNGMCCFVLNPDQKNIRVFDLNLSGAPLIDIMIMGEDGLVYSYWGWSVNIADFSDTSESESDTDSDSEMSVVTHFKGYVNNAFELLSAGFQFISNNDICLMMIGIAFASAGLAIIGKSFSISFR